MGTNHPAAATMWSEARHVIDLVAIGLLWVVAGSPRPGQHRLPAVPAT